MLGRRNRKSGRRLLTDSSPQWCWTTRLMTSDPRYSRQHESVFAPSSIDPFAAHEAENPLDDVDGLGNRPRRDLLAQGANRHDLVALLGVERLTAAVVDRVVRRRLDGPPLLRRRQQLAREPMAEQATHRRP